MFLFDTYTEIFTILWDVVISLMIIRLAFFYFSLTFLTGCVLGYIRYKSIIPTYRLSQPTAELLELPFMLLAICLWARLIVTRYSVPNVAWMRLAIGFIALGCMLIAELAGGSVMYAKGREVRVGAPDKIARGAFAASLLLFGLMPWLLMKAGKKEDMPALEVVREKDTAII